MEEDLTVWIDNQQSCYLKLRKVAFSGKPWSFTVVMVTSILAEDGLRIFSGEMAFPYGKGQLLASDCHMTWFPRFHPLFLWVRKLRQQYQYCLSAIGL